jgi:4'-phosphopantetheinyl transferase
MIEIYAIKQKEKIEESVFNCLFNYISIDKQKRIKRFKFWQDEQRALLGAVLIKKLIAGKLSLNPEKIILKQNEYGKPHLESQPNFYFNISHSGSWVVCGISNNCIGIDVEKIKEINFDIAKRFFSIEENNDLNKKAGHEKQKYFFDLWTLKESYIKNIGKGLSLPLDSFSIKKNENNITMLDNNTYSFKQYEIDTDYKLSLCIKGKIENDIIKIITVNDLLNL